MQEATFAINHSKKILKKHSKKSAGSNIGVQKAIA